MRLNSYCFPLFGILIFQSVAVLGQPLSARKAPKVSEGSPQQNFPRSAFAPFLKMTLEELKTLQVKLTYVGPQDEPIPSIALTSPFHKLDMQKFVLGAGQQTAPQARLRRPLPWHLLRHWNSTVMHEEGVPLKVAQQRLGHARAETTMTHDTHLRHHASRKARGPFLAVFRHQKSAS